MLFKSITRQFCLQLSPEVIVQKYKGCLVGSLVGDCFGKPFRDSDEVSSSQLQSYFDKLDGPYFKAPFKPYSANIALSLCVGNSLTSLGRYDAVDIAKQFVKVFYQEPNRDYGSNIAKVCIKLRTTKFSDPYQAASEQYNSAGSFGNSAATRVAPLVMLYHNDEESMVSVVKKCSEITHSNNMAVYGALLQAWAIRLALELDHKDEVSYESYLDQLMSKVETFADYDLDKADALNFNKQLEIVRKLLDVGDANAYDVVNLLGHGKIAIYSVPTAIFCFLRCLRPINGVVASNAFRRTIQFSILLGGDCVSIGGMAGALAGAFYGHSQISESLQRHCENVSDMENLAVKLLKS